jgi:hypothetical protein
MLPLAVPVLPLWQIAEYWSREIGNVRPCDEIFDELLSSFWSETLHVKGAADETKIDRLVILKLVNRRREHLGFVLIDGLENCPTFEKLPSGEVIIDTRRHVVLPSDTTTWTDEVIEAAYVKMSKTSFDDFDELIQPVFCTFCTTKEKLHSYCQARGYPLPRFWFAPEHDRTWNTRREHEARTWFKQIIRGPKEKTRRFYWADAKKKFPDMPEDAFDRIWEELAPAEWKKPGPLMRVAKDTK